MMNHPEFGPAGRYPIDPFWSVFFEILADPVGRIVPFQELGIFWGAAVCLPIGFFMLAGAREVIRICRNRDLVPFLFVGLAALVLYTLAHILLFKLFVPSRYIRYPVNMGYCIVLALGLRSVMKTFGSVKIPLPDGIRTLLVVVILVTTLFSAGLRLRDTGLFDYSSCRPLVKALAETPKKSLIAGHPNLMDNVPTFAARKAFVTYELSHPWATGLWQTLRPKIRALFEAYYTDDPETFFLFCRNQGIDYFVVDRRHFTPEFLAREPFFAPFDDLVRRITRGRHSFFLLKDAFPGMSDIDNHLRLVDIQKCHLSFQSVRTQP
jgi:hypothetical protein